jgi:hypothetical protein
MHGGRTAYFVASEKGVLAEPPGPGAAHKDAAPLNVSPLTFDWMTGKRGALVPENRRQEMIDKLVALGQLMNRAADGQPAAGADESDIPAGYTYLGQFIAHEITHDKRGDVLAADMEPENLSTPEIDLDSLYGGEDGPKTHPQLYRKDGVHLRTRETMFTGDFNKSFPNDLPRGTKESVKQALVADPRNDENLAVAQTHAAFIHFHNRVADALAAAGIPADRLFESAREQVIRHYQWIILHDFLPRIVRADVLASVMRDGPRTFKGDGGLFMPLEFSAAAFRIGHSMVRDVYEWNPLRRAGSQHGPARLIALFMQTGFGRDGLDGLNGLKSDWVIDWRHFYDFAPMESFRTLRDVGQTPSLNRSARLDTVFDMHLDRVTGFPDEKIEKAQRAITVRNLLRGFYLELPTGEEVAERMGETKLTPEQVAVGPHRELLEDPLLSGQTPLWYYVLKEAELLGTNPEGKPGNRLGPVGGRIVAETLFTLVRHSRPSILENDDWRPAFGRPASGGEPARFEMIDLLNFAGVVDPVAAYLRVNFPHIDLHED